MKDDDLIQIVNDPSEIGIGPPVAKLYKLRQKSTGLFSSGGSYPQFNQKGKTWTTLSALSGHLGYFGKEIYGRRPASFSSRGTITYDDLEIVVLEVRENEVENMPASEYVKGLHERKEKRKIQKDKRIAKRRLQAAEAELKRAESKLNKIKEQQ